MDIRELGLMTFSQASERWKKEKSYVFQQYTKYPNKFMPGSVDFLKSANSDRGTFVITREGMEYLTGQTEDEANNTEWVIIVEKDSNIVNEQIVQTEKEAVAKLYKTLRMFTEDMGMSFFDLPKRDYLDVNKKNFGIRLPGIVTIYYKKRIGVRK